MPITQINNLMQGAKLDNLIGEAKPLTLNNKEEKSSSINKESSNKVCAICNKAIIGNDFVTANKGTTIICKKCLLRM